MTSKFNLVLFILLAILFFNVQTSKAEAWPNGVGSFENTIGSYYVAPSNSYLRTVLTDNVTFQDASLKVKKVSSRAAMTSEISYGLDEKTTFFTKFDGGYVNERFINTIKRNGVEQNVEINLDYFSVSPTASVLRQLVRTDFSVLSAQVKYLPGEFIFSKEGNLYNKKLMAYELEILLGNAFEANLGKISHYLGAAVKKRWHYQEWKAAAKHIPRLGQVQLNLDAEVGLRPTDKILAVFGVKATWNGGSFSRRPFNDNDIANYVVGTPLNAGQRTQLTSFYKGFSRERSRFTDYQLAYKISRAMSKNSQLSVQGISNIIKGKPLKNNTAVLSYEVKM